VPEPGVAWLDLGRRDVPFDAGRPTPFATSGPVGAVRTLTRIAVAELYDQHARLALPPSEHPELGDWVGCGESHPCTLFDTLSVLADVDDDCRLVDAYRALF